MIACTRLGVKPCSMKRLAAACRSGCAPYFGFLGSLEMPAAFWISRCAWIGEASRHGADCETGSAPAGLFFGQDDRPWTQIRPGALSLQLGWGRMIYLALAEAAVELRVGRRTPENILPRLRKAGHDLALYSRLTPLALLLLGGVPTSGHDPARPSPRSSPT